MAVEHVNSSLDSPSAAVRPKVFFEDEKKHVRLYHADALQVLAETEPESVDLVFADPPYFLSNNGITCQSGKMVSVNKGDWDASKGVEEDFEFSREWLRSCKRILKPNGTIWVSGTLHNIYSIGYAMQVLGYKILNDIAWFKINPPPNLSCRYFTHATETILWAKKNQQAKHKFNYDLMKQENQGKQMQNLWSITAPKPAEKRYGKHPTQKPEELLRRIILSSTEPGDLILDPFAGSGTTAVVAARYGRKSIGVELDEAHLSIAVKRIGDESFGSGLEAPGK